MSWLSKLVKRTSINNIKKGLKKVTLKGAVGAVEKYGAFIPVIGGTIAEVSSFLPQPTTEVSGKNVPVSAVNNLPDTAPIDTKAGNAQDATASSDWLRSNKVSSDTGDPITDFFNNLFGG